jgi:hypothetical protein
MSTRTQCQVLCKLGPVTQDGDSSIAQRTRALVRCALLNDTIPQTSQNSLLMLVLLPLLRLPLLPPAAGTPAGAGASPAGRRRRCSSAPRHTRHTRSPCS